MSGAAGLSVSHLGGISIILACTTAMGLVQVHKQGRRFERGILFDAPHATRESVADRKMQVCRRMSRTVSDLDATYSIIFP